MEINIKDKINADRSDDYEYPIDIIHEALSSINEQLDGFAFVSVKKYDHPIESYTQVGALVTALAGFSTSRDINIQDQLGELQDSYSKYEIIIESSILTDYRYRLMFVGNGLSGYPAKIVLDEDIAYEINKCTDEGYIIIAGDADSFKKYVEGIFNSEGVIKVFRNIQKAVIRHERLCAIEASAES